MNYFINYWFQVYSNNEKKNPLQWLKIINYFYFSVKIEKILRYILLLGILIHFG